MACLRSITDKLQKMKVTKEHMLECFSKNEMKSNPKGQNYTLKT